MFGERIGSSEISGYWGWKRELQDYLLSLLRSSIVRALRIVFAFFAKNFGL